MSIAAALVIAVAAWLKADNEDNSHQEPRMDQAVASTPQWGQLIETGREEAQAKPLNPWPFAEVQVGHRMPVVIQRQARYVLGDPELELRFEDARLARTYNGLDLWVVPGNGVLCMFRGAGVAGTCNTTTQVLRYGLVLQTYKHRNNQKISFQALGIVPDGVVRVPAKVGKRWIELGVVDNTFFIEAQQSVGIPLGHGGPG